MCTRKRRLIIQRYAYRFVLFGCVVGLKKGSISVLFLWPIESFRTIKRLLNQIQRGKEKRGITGSVIDGLTKKIAITVKRIFRCVIKSRTASQKTNDLFLLP